MAPKSLKSKGKRRNPKADTGNNATPRLAPAPYPSVIPPRFRKGLQRSLNTLPPRFRKGFVQTLEGMTPIDGGEAGYVRGVPPGGSLEPSKTGGKEFHDEKPNKPTSPVQGKEQHEGVDRPQAAGPLAALPALVAITNTQHDASTVVPKKRGKKCEVESKVPTGKTEESETRKLRPRSAFKYSR
ncbi:hypothetical protein BDN72DRAFT_932714 [Pluteus cervinus]|uniref:Uncharacterized protein n=1 Tax=Pluteus cervinus TaxID=181527 RepID=A0ACD3ABQ0_9AGAR|nr:hypothetical protein BDN72DRAFT_932714 [Pluteus cervinus]